MAGVRDDAPWCPWNIEFIRRINGLDVGRRRAPHRLRRRVPRPRPRRRLPRRAGRHPARPAAPPRHHEVQPGPHLDPGERGRHRRRLPVHLRHGGPGRLPVRRPHHPGLGHPRRGTAVRARAPRGCCGSSTASAGTPSSAEELLDLRADMAGRAPRRADRAGHVLARRPPASSWPRTRRRSPRSARSRPTRSPPSATPGRRPASSTAGRARRTRPGGRHEVPDGCEGVEAPFVASVCRVDVAPGDVVDADSRCSPSRP